MCQTQKIELEEVRKKFQLFYEAPSKNCHVDFELFFHEEKRMLSDAR